MDSLLQKLVDIEERYHLYEDRFDGVPAWIYIRYGVLQDELIGRARNRKPSQRDLRGSLWQQIRRLFLVCLDDLSSRRHLRQSDLLFISHERRVKWNGSYRCIYTSPLAEKTDSLCVSVLRGDDYREEPIDRNLVYIGMATIRGEIRELTERLFHRGRYRALVKTVRDRWEKPLDEMARAAGVSLDPDRIAAAGAKKILGAPIARRTLKRLLDTVRPKCIIETVSYEWNRMMINELAHEQKIPVVELQHGSMAADHVAYHYGTDKRIPELPDVIFTYSEYWNRMIRMPGEQTRSIATGFPYFEDQVRLYGGQKRADDRTQILFVSQTSVGQALSQAAVYCAERLDPASWRIVYKLHPTEYTGWKTLYPALAQAEGDIL
ncbi:MAG: hypothetical protein II800_03290, partial [Lachnospiraceae bacterium]|nr:hypothetical protein [Lachnospiraceae bacterium]